MRDIIVAHAERLLKDKRAILIGATQQDEYRAAAGAWLPAVDIGHNTPATAVRHFGRHETQAGERLRVENDAGRAVAVVRVDAIRYVRTVDLSTEQIAALGYADRDAMIEDEPGYTDRGAWYVQVHPVRRILWGWL